MRGYPQFSFWISIALAKICFSRIVINRARILRPVLVGTVLKSIQTGGLLDLEPLDG